MHKILVAAFLGSCLIASTAGFAQDAMMPSGVKSMGGMLTDGKGMTLYTYDRDSHFQSTCNGACAKAWPPLPARSEHNHGSWAMMMRSDGTKQWAYRGKPVYTFAQDKAPGDAKGDNLGPKGSHLWHVIKVVG